MNSWITPVGMTVRSARMSVPCCTPTSRPVSSWVSPRRIMFPPPRSTCTALSREAPGTIIGRYKLLQQIGEGGFGVVFMAQQQQPIRRRVALKIIKLGMDTRQVIARFEAERQALAMMDHPNIAQVLDAGATEHGRPFFVMEFSARRPYHRVL